VHGWNYKRGPNRRDGLTTWGNVSAYCLGSAQSPINLDTTKAQHHHHHYHLNFEKYDLVNQENTILENNGHAIELKVTSIPAGAAMMSGGPLANSYELLQLHFHWGKRNSRGSEHTINRKRFPLEMHLVHLSSNIEWGVGSATAPVNVPDGLAVAAFLWKISKKDNPDMTPIIERLEEITDAGTETELVDALNISSLISPAISGPYYSYHGSLTTPGCNEVVHWIVFQTPLTISARQLARFRQVHDNEGNHMMDNYRPTQATNNRTVNFYVLA